MKQTTTRNLDLAHAKISIEKTTDNNFIVWVYNKSIDEHVSVKLDEQQFDMLRCMAVAEF